jgi:hypothetical protein
MAASFIGASLQRPTALDQLENQHHNRNDEQDVNESAQRVGADNSKQPEHQQDHEYCPEHKIPFGYSHVPSWDAIPLRLWKPKFLHGSPICSVFGERSRLQFFDYGTQVPVRCLELLTRRIVIALR